MFLCVWVIEEKYLMSGKSISGQQLVSAIFFATHLVLVKDPKDERGKLGWVPVWKELLVYSQEALPRNKIIIIRWW